MPPVRPRQRVATIVQPVNAVLTEAEHYRGEVELPSGSNRSVRIDYWNYEAIGLWKPFPVGAQGAPWCVAYINAVGRQALGYAWPLPRVMSAAQAVADWGAGKGIKHELPKVGDIFAKYYPTAGRYGHVGFVTGVEGNRIRTIEGNTNEGGSREGYGVFERTRQVTDQYCFIRWIDLL